ncbi:MAG: class I tRNA ligase family protein, partial [Oscillospiraceae bacterium]|nr:class I tRNA ligase family protein [Oscillospiraceae bacterium]
VYCKDCKKPIITDAIVKYIADVFREEGSDAWWIKETKDLIPADTVCECGCREFTKEFDIMDVWFDSGVSHTAVLDIYDELSSPADLYLEGADQYRGWFQSSLLTSVVYKGVSPYKSVCTHGWVVDGEGKAMHKSLGNGIAPEEIVEQYGADILRLWVASSDYHSDIRISKDILSQLSDAYRKIRNTARYILGNFSDGESVFNPDTDCVPDEKLEELDRWILMRLDALTEKVNAGYDAYDFHVVFHAIHNFCVVDLSSFYLDIVKDRLYCEKIDAPTRRAAQTAMYRVLDSLVRMAAPILSFTSEEIWQNLPHRSVDDARSVFLNQFQSRTNIAVDAEFVEKWNMIYTIRESVNKKLEEKRNEKLIGKSLEARVIITTSPEMAEKLTSWTELKDVLIVSALEVRTGDTGEEAFAYEIEKATGKKCERCWCYSEEVGKIALHPTLCRRCAEVIGE